jgi:hypothetical protein
MKLIKQNELIVGNKYKLDIVTGVETVFKGEMLDEIGQKSLAFEPTNNVILYELDDVTGFIHFLIEEEGTPEYEYAFFIEIEENV